MGDDGVDGEQWQLVAVTQVLQVGQIISAMCLGDDEVNGEQWQLVTVIRVQVQNEGAGLILSRL